MLLTFEAHQPLADAEAKFISMSRVANGIREFDWEQARGEDVRLAGAKVLAARPFKRRQPVPAQATRLLRVAWQTELAARLGEQLDDPGLRLATLQTLPVQAYYAVFNAGRALTHTAGAPRDVHAALHDTFAGEHYRRAPGSLGVQLSGDPADPGACHLTPAICAPSAFNTMEARADNADYVWAALRMARRWRLDRSRSRWLADSRNRTAKGKPYKVLPARARLDLVAGERPTTLVDFLYELRCATNYRSIDEYAGDIGDELVQRFHGGLMHLMDLGLLCYEGQIALYSGAAAVRAEFETWAAQVQSVGAWAAASGRARSEALLTVGL